MTVQNPARAELAAFKGMRVVELERGATGRGGLAETSLLQTGAWTLGWDLSMQAILEPAPELGEFGRRASGTQHD